MGLTLDLPPALEAELIREAAREGVTPAEHVASLVKLALAITADVRSHSPGQDVKTFLVQSTERPDVAKSLLGRYAHLGVTSEDAARAKQEEIELEERRFR